MYAKKKKVEGTGFITMSPKKKKKEKSQILSELIPVSADLSKYCSKLQQLYLLLNLLFNIFIEKHVYYSIIN